jgi:hypothetical protein
MAYDARRDETVLLVPGTPNQTWVFDGGTRRWTRRFPATSPIVRPALATFDAARGEVVALATNADALNCDPTAPVETWLWDGTTWRQAHPAAAPAECPTLGSTGMTYDAAHRNVLLVASNVESETWLWNGVTWTNMGSAPSQASVAYDPISRRVLSFGGYFFWHGDWIYGDTNAWNGTRWTQLAAGGRPRDPAPRAWTSMTYDPVVRGLVLFGGYSKQGLLADTWRRVGTHWVRMGTETSPPPTAGAPFVTDTAHHLEVLLDRGQTWLLTSAHAGRGYFLGEQDGTVVAYGNARQVGDAHTLPLRQPVIGIARTVTRKGYWLAAADGGVFTYGDARYHGGTGGIHLNQPIVAMAATPSGGGYWLVARDGGVFTFGDAAYFGSTGGRRLSQPIVAFAPTPTGDGYWLVAADGGVFCFGDARYYGSAAGTRLAQPVTGVAVTPRGNGYWLVTRAGGVLGYGSAAYKGATRSTHPVVAIASSPTGLGYTTFDAAGGVNTFGDATNHGHIRTPEHLTAVVGAVAT